MVDIVQLTRFANRIANPSSGLRGVKVWPGSSGFLVSQA